MLKAALRYQILTLMTGLSLPATLVISRVRSLVKDLTTAIEVTGEAKLGSVVTCEVRLPITTESKVPKKLLCYPFWSRFSVALPLN